VLSELALTDCKKKRRVVSIGAARKTVLKKRVHFALRFALGKASPRSPGEAPGVNPLFDFRTASVSLCGLIRSVCLSLVCRAHSVASH